MFKSLLFHRWQALAVMLVVAVLGCGDDGPTQPPPAGPAAKLVFSVQPADSFPAGPFATAVTVQDADGITVIAYTDSVTLTIGTNPSGGTLSGTTKVAPSGNGIANYLAVALDLVGTGYTVTASAEGLTSATSEAFNVLMADPGQVAFTVEPTTTIAGPSADTLDVDEVITPPIEVEVRDEFGNLTQGEVEISIKSGPSGATLSGETEVDTDANSIAQWDDLSLDKVGSYTLEATSGDGSATSVSFTITVAPAAQVAFVTAPADRQRRTTMVPEIEVEIQDEFGNLVTAATDNVTLAIKANPGSMVFHASGSPPGDYNLVDPVSAAEVLAPLANTSPDEVTALTYDEESGLVVSADLNSDLNSVDPADGTTTFLGVTAVTLKGLAFESDSVLLGVDKDSDELYSIDPADWSSTLLGSVTGTTIVGFNGLAIDPTTDEVYAVKRAMSGNPAGLVRELITIDVATLVATEVDTLSEDGVAGIAFLPDGTLLAVTGDGATNPAQLWTVNKATGAMTLIIDLASPDDGEAIAGIPAQLSGTLTLVASGGVVTFSDLEIDAPAAGYTFVVTVTGLDDGTSAAFEITN